MSMVDKREDILERLRAILEEQAAALSFKSVVRNRGLMSNEQRPALALLDGDELPRGIVPSTRNGDRYSGLRPRLMGMQPEVYILRDELRPQNEKPDGSENIGAIVNANRIAIVDAICTDAALKALLGTNGGIVYNGCVTDLKSGLALSGQMRIDFELRYFFDPTA